MRNYFCCLTIYFAAFLFFGAGVCSVQEPADANSHSFIRIAVSKDADSEKILIAGSFRIIDYLSKATLMEEKYLPESYLVAGDSGFRLGKKEINSSAIAIEPVGGARVYINGRIFRGEIRAYKNDKKITIVNSVDLEEYLYGVIRNEVSTWWPMEALKAQAIAARTYALNQISESKSKDYDVTADVYSQVYGGIFSEKWRTNRAVDQTKGKVLTYNGKVFPAFFHATCGGSTFDAAYLWNVDLPPLRGVKCGWCRRSPHYRWERWLPVEEVEQKIEAAGYYVGNIIGFEITRIDPFSSRILELRIKGDKGSTNISAKDFRRIIGGDILRSANFKVALVGGYVAFEGLGWGHGVGLCQWGAYYMSRAGKKAEEILQFYYPGSKIVDYKNAK